MDKNSPFFFKTEFGKNYKKRIIKKLNSKIKEITYIFNKAIQEDSLNYGIYYKFLNKKLYRELGYDLKIFFDFKNLKFYYTLYSLKSKLPISNIVINILEKNERIFLCERKKR